MRACVLSFSPRAVVTALVKEFFLCVRSRYLLFRLFQRTLLHVLLSDVPRCHSSTPTITIEARPTTNEHPPPQLPRRNGIPRLGVLSKRLQLERLLRNQRQVHLLHRTQRRSCLDGSRLLPPHLSIRRCVGRPSRRRQRLPSQDGVLQQGHLRPRLGGVPLLRGVRRHVVRANSLSQRVLQPRNLHDPEGPS